MAFSFEKLLVNQKSVDFADAICGVTEELSRGYGFLVDQLNRASLSIAANIAEGNGRFTKPDRRNVFGIARGSVQECVPSLELARRRSLWTDAKPNPDGSFTIRFSGPKVIANRLPIMPGWNYTVRLYRPREEVIDGNWKFPDAQTVK